MVNSGSPLTREPVSVRTARSNCSFLACGTRNVRSEEHTSELQSQSNLVCRLLLEKKKEYNAKGVHLFSLHAVADVLGRRDLRKIRGCALRCLGTSDDPRGPACVPAAPPGLDRVGR